MEGQETTKKKILLWVLFGIIGFAGGFFLFAILTIILLSLGILTI